jgi:hypothetical protein
VFKAPFGHALKQGNVNLRTEVVYKDCVKGRYKKGCFLLSLMNKLVKHIYKPFIFLTLFAVAMGLLEAAVVFYIRKLYYPTGFSFPLKILPTEIIAVELLREVATIIMLVAVAILAGKTFMQRFASFIYIFGVWDIFYYIWLKVLLNWPESVLTWDILFLIPITWLGPVLAPLILSTTMLVFSAMIIRFEVHKKSTKLIGKEWFMLIGGSVIVFITFVWEYCRLLIINDATTYQQARELIAQHVPTTYNWLLFILGELLIIAAITSYYQRYKK